MCGIVGHLGPQNSLEIVLEGLKRLEYRGYDSAGVSFVNESKNLEHYKKEGKLENLKNLLGKKSYTALSCIGHTRWATHGKVNDTNSHPHSYENFAVVHNGIIENYAELKEEALEKGYKFSSETDSETFVAHLWLSYQEEKDLLNAAIKTFKKVKGNSAFVILEENSGEIVAVKRSAPLVCGTHESGLEGLVSSDPYALVGLVDKLYFPDDEVFCVLKPKGQLISFFEMDGTSSSRYIVKNQEISLDEADKGHFEHYMLKEIYEQPELIRSHIQYYFFGDGFESLLKIAEKSHPSQIRISACGTAYYAGLVVRDYIEQIYRISCSAELASEFRYRSPLLNKDDIGLFISQSGETADTLAAQHLCKENNIHTLSIVNVDSSTLFRECDDNLLIKAGVEIGVASTKAFTLMALTGRLFISALAGNLQIEEKRKKLIKKYNLLADRIDQILENVQLIKDIAGDIYNYNGYFFTGRGIYYPVALEGALKLKEIAYVHAEGYAAGELKHGPIALIDEKMVNIAIVGPELYDKTVSNIQEIKARKGLIVSIGPENDKNLQKISDYYIPMNFEGLDELSPLYVNVVNQLLAYYMAKFKGTDIDKPRNLAKSVTVE